MKKWIYWQLTYLRDKKWCFFYPVIDWIRYELFEEYMTRTDMTPIDLLKEFNHLAPSDIDDILESLYSNDMLNKKGKEFASDFWEMFIQEDNL